MRRRDPVPPAPPKAIPTARRKLMNYAGSRTSSIVDYADADHAQRFPSTAGTQEPIEPALAADLLATLEQDGYAIVPEVLSTDQVATIREAVAPLFRHHVGRNAFEGFRTRRLYSPLDDTDALDGIVEHPTALGVIDRILDPNYLLSQLQVIDILPGEDAQLLHTDDGFYSWPRPRPPLGVATIIAIDDFTEDNGATRLIPGSHKWDQRLPSEREEAGAVPAVMPAGSMLIFLGTTWHGGGANHTSRSRMCVTAQYCAPTCRPQESFLLSVSRTRVARSSEHLQRLLGYSIAPPFVGFVGGMHPKRVLPAPQPSDSADSP
jgi:hypothetical protein